MIKTEIELRKDFDKVKKLAVEFNDLLDMYQQTKRLMERMEDEKSYINYRYIDTNRFKPEELEEDFAGYVNDLIADYVNDEGIFKIEKSSGE